MGARLWSVNLATAAVMPLVTNLNTQNRIAVAAGKNRLRRSAHLRSWLTRPPVSAFNCVWSSSW